MHTEEIRVRLAARSFRSLISAGEINRHRSSETLLRAADRYTGYTRITLPDDDPLLAGGFALLDRDFQTIWLSAARSRAQQFLDAAHEYGHLILHSNAPEDQSELRTIEIVGYSKNQRDEVDAHRFAAELLLPSKLASELILAGETASTISKELLVPYQTVVQQLCISGAGQLLRSDKAHANILLDTWQMDAIHSKTSCLVIGAPGTGKTTALLAKVDHLINASNIAPNKTIVVGDSDHSANEIRRQLVLSGDPKATIVPVTTPYRLAYDLLVRFPEIVGLSQGWEERKYETGNNPVPEAKDFPSLALQMVTQEPSVISSLGGRYHQFLIDNLDELDRDSLQFLLAVVPKSGVGLWATATETSKLVSDEGLWTKVYELRFQYRYAQNLQRFVEKIGPTRRRLAVCRREKTTRCDIGSVTVAVAQKSEQTLAGILDFVDGILKQGYSRGDILVLLKTGSESRDIVWRDELRAALNSTLAPKDDRPHAQELLSFIKLCCGSTSRRDYLRAGQAQRYGVPFNELINQSVEYSPSNSLLQTDIKVCQAAGDPRAMLTKYLFEQTDYLRVSPHAFEPAVSLMTKLSFIQRGISESELLKSLESIQRELDDPIARDLGIEGQAIRIEIYSRSRTDLAPIVVVPDASIDQLVLLLEQKYAAGSVLQAAALLATDHILYCTQSNKAGGDLLRLQRMVSKFTGLTALDWTKNRNKVSKQGAQSRLPISLSPDDLQLYQQCPRRVYYKNVLEPSQMNAVSLNPARYPATPADRGFCTACLYSEICPET